MPTVAFIGCAHIHTDDYVQAIAASGDIKVCAVFDRVAEGALRISEATGAPAVANYEELARQRPDGLLVLSETAHHPADVEAALRLSRPLFVEKPLAIDRVSAEKIAQEIARHGVPFHTGFFLRTIPAFTRLKELLRAETIGRIIDARVRFAHDGAIAGWLDTTSWISDPSIAGYGGFGDLAIHGIDLLSWLLEEPVVSGSALLGRHLGLNSDDHGTGIVKFRSGIIAILEAGWCDPMPHFEFRIGGSAGVAEIGRDNRLVVTLADSLVKQSDGSAGPKSIDLGLIELDARSGLEPFLACVRSGKTDERTVSVNDALAANLAVDRLYKVKTTD